VDSQGQTIWIADAHRDNGKRLVVRADEKLTAFMELKAAIRVCGKLSRQAGDVTVGPKWSLEGVFPSRAVFKRGRASGSTLRMGFTYTLSAMDLSTS